MIVVIALFFFVAGSVLLGLAIHDTFTQAWSVLTQ